MRDARGIEERLVALLELDGSEGIANRQAAVGGGSHSPPPPPPLNYGGPGGTSMPMESRVTALETHMGYVHRDLQAITGKLDKLIDQTADLPTKRDLSTFRWQWVATAAAAIAIIIGSIIGGLSWIKPDASPPSPIVVQMPAPITSPAPGARVSAKDGL